MGDIPEFITNLNDTGLRSELGKFGVKTGPITPTTRRLLQRRLTLKLGLALKEPKTSSSERNDDKKISGTDSKDIENEKDSLKLDEKTITAPKQTFYGVHLPKNDAGIENTEAIVFESKSSTILSMKEHKNARFKVFGNFNQAKEYSLKGPEEKLSKSSTFSAPDTEETENKFPSLKQEDLNKLLRSIESGDIEQMKVLVWSNPKYLINSADGPVVIKASARYNSLHIAAKSNKAEICSEILSTIENLLFQNLMFPNSNNEKVSGQRTEHLIDSYLNTPEKMVFETPLHFACKHGFKDVVAVLVSYSQCQMTPQNKYGQTPFQVICSRATTDYMGYKGEIEKLLGDQYYVPLLRFHDNSEHAIIGTPITTKQKPEDYAAASPMLQNHSFNFPHDNDSPLAPTLTVSALAGPMHKDQALKFKKCWLTPSKRKDLKCSAMFLRRADSEKGDEQIGRQLAEKENVGWVEYWEFLSDFANFSSEDGLLKLENFLRERMPISPPIIKGTQSLSRDISELADLLDNIHLDPKFHTETTNGTLPIGSHSMQDKSCHHPGNLFDKTTPEKYFSDSKSTNSSDSYSKYKTPPQHFNESYDESNDSGKCNTCMTDASLVKKLFTPEKLEKKPSINTLSVNFMENLTLNPKFKYLETSLFTTEDDVPASKRPTRQYRIATESCSDVFSSPSVSDLSENSSTTDNHCTNVYLAGNAPTKLDRDVLIAIGDTDIDVTKFPSIFQWKNSVGVFSENERSKWATPRKVRAFSFPSELTNSTPIRSSNVNFSFLTPSSGPTNNLFTPDRNMRRYLYRSFKLSNAE